MLKRGADGRLQISGVTCAPGGERSALDAIFQRCGRELMVAGDLARFDLATAQELELLRSFDPARAILA